MNKLFIVTSLLFLTLLKNSEAQIGSQLLGSQPSYTNWYSIENNAIKVIFPDSVTNEAQRIANVINHIHQKCKKNGYKTLRLISKLTIPINCKKMCCLNTYNNIDKK